MCLTSLGLLVERLVRLGSHSRHHAVEPCGFLQLQLSSKDSGNLPLEQEGKGRETEAQFVNEMLVKQASRELQRCGSNVLCECASARATVPKDLSSLPLGMMKCMLRFQGSGVLSAGGRYESYGCGKCRHGIFLPPAFRSPVTGAASLACQDVVVLEPF